MLYYGNSYGDMDIKLPIFGQRAIATKYGDCKGGWSTKVYKRGLWVWWFLAQYQFSEGWESFSKHLAVVVGDGTHILFWYDRWVEDNPLKLLYLKLYQCSANEEACISNVLGHPKVGNNRVWNLKFYRDFHDWELEAVFSFLDFIQSQILRGAGCDSLCWWLNGSGKFDTRSFYNEIDVFDSTFSCVTRLIFHSNFSVCDGPKPLTQSQRTPHSHCNNTQDRLYRDV